MCTVYDCLVCDFVWWFLLFTLRQCAAVNTGANAAAAVAASGAVAAECW